MTPANWNITHTIRGLSTCIVNHTFAFEHFFRSSGLCDYWQVLAGNQRGPNCDRVAGECATHCFVAIIISRGDVVAEKSNEAKSVKSLLKRE